MEYPEEYINPEMQAKADYYSNQSREFRKKYLSGEITYQQLQQFMNEYINFMKLYFKDIDLDEVIAFVKELAKTLKY
ncbi:MAG: hypothetical protein K2K06_12190 [Oscillospiraceae bacterium]|nr:hypothetical protein [Oscillospiraceae bacterium]